MTVVATAAPCDRAWSLAIRGVQQCTGDDDQSEAEIGGNAGARTDQQNRSQWRDDGPDDVAGRERQAAQRQDTAEDRGQSQPDDDPDHRLQPTRTAEDRQVQHLATDLDDRKQRDQGSVCQQANEQVDQAGEAQHQQRPHRSPLAEDEVPVVGRVGADVEDARQPTPHAGTIPT